jgi:hypothetical protein
MGGEFIHARYGGNLYAALTASFPDHGWQRLLFSKSASVQHSAIQQSGSAMSILDSIYRELALSSLDDWASLVSLNHLYQLGVLEAVLHAGGLPAMLRSAYPNHSWVADAKFLVSQVHAVQELFVAIILRHVSSVGDRSYSMCHSCPTR